MKLSVQEFIYSNKLGYSSSRSKPVFCDVEDDLLFSSDSFKSLVTSKTRAFIPVHLTGRFVDEVQKYCQERNIDIIEDVAQSFGAQRQAACGSLGIAGAFSLHPLKNLSIYGDGGIITTNSRKIADKCSYFEIMDLNPEIVLLYGDIIHV